MSPSDAAGHTVLAEADSRYMQGRSFLGDIRIIAATVLGGGAGDALKG